MAFFSKKTVSEFQTFGFLSIVASSGILVFVATKKYITDTVFSGDMPTNLSEFDKLLYNQFIPGLLSSLVIILPFSYYIQFRTNRKIQSEYTYIDIPDKFRGIFQDMMRGFEDYCAIKGIPIKISIENSFENKIAFKVSYDGSKNIDEEEIKIAFKDYKEGLNKNTYFEDIKPKNPKDFQLFLQLQNRVNLLENDKRNLQSMLKWQEDSFLKIMDKDFKIYPIQTAPINIKMESNHDNSSNYNAENGSNLVVGDNNISTVSISNSFNKRKEQIEKINELLTFLKEELNNNKDNPQFDELATSLHQIKGSLKDDDNPDSNKISKWLTNAKHAVEQLVLSHHAVEAFHWILKSFGAH